MTITIRSNYRLTSEQREHVERRLRFALGRFGYRLSAITARIDDVNGPRGGIDKRCRVIVSLRRRGRIAVDSMDATLAAAVDSASDRVGRAVAQAVERLRRPWAMHAQ